MRADSQQEQIRGVLTICKDRWRADGASEGRIEAMSRELEEELRYATENGETVEEVVGPDIQVFAKQWTGDSLDPESPKERIMVSLVVIALFLVVGVLIALRLVTYFDASLPWYAVIVLSALAAAVLLFWTGRSR